MVTVTPHLRHAIGVVLVSEDVRRGVFIPLLAAETAVPARRAGIFETPRGGGDVLVKVCEAQRDIKVTKSTPRLNGKTPESDTEAEDDDSDEDAEVREKIWQVGTVLAEACIRGVKKGGKVEVTVNVGGDLGVLVTAREVGGKGGVRGTLAQLQNGMAG